MGLSHGAWDMHAYIKKVLAVYLELQSQGTAAAFYVGAGAQARVPML